MSANPFGPVLRGVREKLGLDPGESADALLLERFALARDESAFAALVERHGPLVWGVCRRVAGDGHHAEDAFQATWIVLARKAGSLSGGALPGWLHRVAYRLSLAARARPAAPLEDALAAAPGPAEEAARREARAAIDEEVNRLPAKYRLPVLLCFFEGRTHAEAAAELGWPVGTVAGRLARAKDLLHTRLTRRGLASTAVPLPAVLGSATGQAASSAQVAAAVHTAKAVAAGRPIEGLAATLAEGVTKTTLHRRALVWLAALVLTAAGAAAAAAVFRPVAPQGGAAPAVPAPLPVPGSGFVAVLPPTNSNGWELFGSLSLSGDGTLLATGSGSWWVLWDTRTGRRLWEQRLQFGGPACVSLSGDGKLLAVGSGSWDRTATLWDTVTGKQLLTVRHPGKVLAGFTAVSLSANGKLLVTGCQSGDNPALQFGDNTAILWDTGTGKPLHTFQGHTRGILSVCLSADGRVLATGSEDGAVDLWSAATGKKLHVLRAESTKPYHIGGNGVSLSADGKVLATAGRKAAALWDTATGKELRAFPGAGSVSLSADGKLLAATGIEGDRTAALWDPVTGKKLLTIPGPGGNGFYPAVTLSADGKRLWTGGIVRLWDTALGRELCALMYLPGTGDEDTKAPPWLAATPQGWFDGDAWFKKHLHFREAGTGRLVDDDATRRRLQRPDLVARILRGDPSAK